MRSETGNDKSQSALVLDAVETCREETFSATPCIDQSAPAEQIEPNTTILDTIGEKTLTAMLQPVLTLTGTSLAVFEQNGMYALKLFGSDYCRLLDQASRNMCFTHDNSEAMKGGRWHCHESGWKAAKAAMQTGRASDLVCAGGIHKTAVPIFSEDVVVGAISIGYGDPPQDPSDLDVVAKRYHLDKNELKSLAGSHISRPAFIRKAAVESLQYMAMTIGRLIDQKKAEQRWIDRENELKRTLDAATDGIWTLDLLSNAVFFSDSYHALLGYPDKDPPFTLESWLEHIHPDDRQKTEKMIKTFPDSPLATFRHVFRVQSASGDYHWIRARGKTAVNTKQGRPCKMIGTFEDITELKKEEMMRLESEARFKLIFDHVQAGIIIIDPAEHIVVDINQKALDLTGYKKEEIIGRKCNQRFCPIEDGNCPVTVFGETTINAEREFLNRKGETIPILKTVMPITLHGREHILCSFVDLILARQVQCERKEMEKQIRQAQKMEAIGALAGGIAHDFNNILFPIIGLCEMLMEDTPRQTPAHERLSEILHGAIRARDLVKQILTFSRQADQEVKPMRIQLIIKEVLRLLRSTLPATIEIHQDIGKQCGMILADPIQIHQVVMNLVTNAFHAMEEHGGLLTVRLYQKRLGFDDLPNISMEPGDYACLEISDTGHGMDDETKSKIFEPYFTTKKKERGTGLGLSVVHGIVRSHGGDISVASRPKEGTTFRLCFPVIESADTPMITDRVEDIIHGSGHILLVDDEDPIVRMAKTTLERLGYTVTSRTSPLEALETYKNNPDGFDLVLTDMTMPKLTGLQLAHEIRKLRPKAKIIITTGFSEQINQQVIDHYKLQGLIIKPMARKEMAETIHDALEGE